MAVKFFCGQRGLLSETVRRKIQSVCDLCATAVFISTRYNIRRWDQRVPPIMAYLATEGRLLGLKPSEWSMLLVGVALCGFLTLIF